MICKTTNGPAFEIDATDFKRISNRKWHYQRYVRATYDGKIVRLHNHLFGYAPTGYEWDHIDRNTLNNKRSNLRLVSHGDNMRNKRVPRNNRSGFKGVCWHKRAEKWIAQLKLDGKIKHLGYFENLKDAINARKVAESCYLGETDDRRG